jgi:type VI secretion system protein ImpM
VAVNPRIGVFGKLPTAGDFVAHNAASPAARELQSWLVAEIENLAAKRKHVPGVPVKFLLRDSAGTDACIGAFAPSRDRVGREFPLCVFATIDTPVACHRFPSLPTAYAGFLDHAAKLCTDAQALGLDLTGVQLRTDMLPLPGPQELEEARTWTHQALEATPGQTLLEALFGPVAGGVALHGVNMFATACAHVKGGDPGRATIVLDCPASDDVQLVFWLRLARELLAWRRASPSVFWTGPGGPHTRLLVTLGAPTAGVLHFIADPTVTAEKLWPMRTQSASVIDGARKSLSPMRVQMLSRPPSTAAQLLDALVAG